MAVLAYSSQFNFPLSLSAIYERLLTSSALKIVDRDLEENLNWKTTPLALKEELAVTLKSLLKKKSVIEHHGFYALRSQEIAFEKRRLASINQRAKQAVIQELVATVRRIPWILGVAITGSHAVGGAAAQDDIDFMVITQVNRLWLSRLILLWHSWRRGRRPKLPGGDISHSWDLNFWLAENRLALPATKQSAYEAYELLQTRWVYNKAQIRRKIHQANPWVKDFLVTWQPAANKKLPLSKPKFGLLNLLDLMAFWLEISYRTLRHGRQRADRQSAFFHSPGTKQQLFLAWKSRYKQVLGKTVVLVTGVFDVLHQEHYRFLRAAKKAGNWLAVGLESDARVKAMKGDDRPINSQTDRVANLKQWQIADEVFILPENFDQREIREKLIERLRPQILAVSSHTPHLESKRKVMKKYGGKVKVVYRFRPGVSSTKLIKQGKR